MPKLMPSLKIFDLLIRIMIKPAKEGLQIGASEIVANPRMELPAIKDKNESFFSLQAID